MGAKRRSKRGAGPASTIRGDRPGSSINVSTSRPLRADAAANRDKILVAAAEMLSQKGPDVSLDEIAARAGVGAGTLHRHFPTKEALMDATIAEGLTELGRTAAGLAHAEDPVAAFYGFFVHAVERGGAIHALARRLWGSAVDVDGAIAAPLRDLRTGIALLFRRAQGAGGVRGDLDVPHLDAMLAGAHAINVHAHGGRRLVEILCDAMRGRQELTGGSHLGPRTRPAVFHAPSAMKRRRSA